MSKEIAENVAEALDRLGIVAVVEADRDPAYIVIVYSDAGTEVFRIIEAE